MLQIAKNTFGIGDRFAHQGKAQLQAFLQARALGLEVYPIWNKSHREHTLIGSRPDDLRAEADAAVQALGWQGAYYVDADHINLRTVDGFLAASDFYTLDVADCIGKTAEPAAIERFVASMGNYGDFLQIPGLAEPLALAPAIRRAAAEKFLRAVQEAGKIYRHLAARKRPESFVTEISMDETDSPQTPVELFLILAMIAQEKIPVQTIAPKFTGRFNKGVNYVGDLARFEREFGEDLSVITLAIRAFGLPTTLKLSVHSGSDKFSLYPIINRLAKQHGTGLHVKTAGTTWLEEVIGLAESGGEGLAIAQEIYAHAHAHFDELTGPYATVIDIDRAQLPLPEIVQKWSAEKTANTLRHVPSHPDYNPHFRQLIHVGFKVAARLGARYTDALRANEAIIARNVTANLFERHLLPIFA